MSTYVSISNELELKTTQLVPKIFQFSVLCGTCFVFSVPTLTLAKIRPCKADEKFRSTFIPLASAECDDSLPFSGTSSITFCHELFPTRLLQQLFFHPLSPYLAIYFLVCLSILLFQNSYIIPFWEIYFLPSSVHAPNQRIIFNPIVYIIVGFLTLA